MDNEGTVCAGCGRRLPPSSVRDTWRVVRIPALDTGVWGMIFTDVGVALVLLCLCLFGADYAISGQNAVTLWTTGGMIGNVLLVGAGCLLAALLVLLLQGREEVRYALDAVGVHMQVWIRPVRVKCWARFQSAHLEDAVDDGAGDQLLLVQESHLLWADVKRTHANEKKGEIQLYRGAFPAITLHIPQDEYENADAFVKSKTKKTIKK